MPQHVVKRGLDIPIAGRAAGKPVQLDPPDTVSYSPTELAGIVPRLAAREGDAVQRGSPLFTAKSHPEMKFLSPVSGRVKEIRRGKRRVILDVVVEREGDLSETLPSYPIAALRDISRSDAASAILAGGMWAILRTRPLDEIPDPAAAPQSILVCATETGPLQPGADVLIGEDDGEALQAGLYALRALTDGKVFLTVPVGHDHPALARLDGVEVHEFRGPHPAGDAAVQVNLIDPIRGNGQVWYARAWDVAALGRTLLEGQFASERVYAAVGAGVKQPRYVRTVLGAPLGHIVGDVIDGPARWIRGSVLTGVATDADRWASWYRRGVHVLPEKVHKVLAGWWLPRFGEWSAHRTYISGFLPAMGEHDLRPGLWGGHRGLVPIGQYRNVIVTPDIIPEFLIKAITARDLEESLQLGLLDFTPEEAALCTYVCPSKIELDVLLQQGLEHYKAES